MRSSLFLQSLVSCIVSLSMARHGEKRFVASTRAVSTEKRQKNERGRQSVAQLASCAQNPACQRSSTPGDRKRVEEQKPPAGSVLSSFAARESKAEHALLPGIFHAKAQKVGPGSAQKGGWCGRTWETELRFLSGSAATCLSKTPTTFKANLAPFLAAFLTAHFASTTSTMRGGARQK